MSVDALTLVTVAAIVVTIWWAGIAATSLATSVWYYRRSHQRLATRQRVRKELFDRRREADPDLQTWIEGLSSRERRELESVVERYLRTVSGDERAIYLDIAGKLDMGERALEQLAQSAVIPRLRALARLTVLAYPVETDRLLQTCLDTRETREATARLLLTRRNEYDQAQSLGTALLLWDGRSPMTARGLETLSGLNEEDPLTLLFQGYWAHDRWDQTTIVQVASVLEYCRTPADKEWFSWLFDLFDREEPAVRAAAVRAFGEMGWRDDLRAEIPFRALVTDNPNVRRSTYRLLARWGDDRAHDLLEWAVIDEDDDRAQLLAVTALAWLEGDPDPEQPGWPTASWAWVRAERAAVGRRKPATEGVLA